VAHPLRHAKGGAFELVFFGHGCHFASGCYSLSWNYDAWGNRLSQNNGGGSCLSPSHAIMPNNRITDIGYSYDAAGNMTSDAVHTYTYDAENRLTQVDGGSTATYMYDAEGQRVQKTAGGVSTNYVFSGGQALAEYNVSTSGFSDYIFANGRTLARADTYDSRILIQGTVPAGASGQYEGYNFSGPNAYSGYVIQNGDQLFVRQFQSTTACGGPDIDFTDGSRMAFVATDSDGIISNMDSVHNQWHFRRFNLNAFAGKTIYEPLLLAEGCTEPGDWQIFYSDFVLVSADGTVRPIYTRDSSVSLAMWGSSEMVSPSYVVDYSSATGDAMNAAENTTYYHGDHLGSARILTSGGGWPVWSGTFLPFGQEWNPQSTVNHYKFTGKERDGETNLDNFGARYMSSSLGRFMSADEMKYSVLADPQTLNLYSYVANNPLNAIDPTGHAPSLNMPTLLGDSPTPATQELDEGNAEHQENLDYTNTCNEDRNECKAEEEEEETQQKAVQQQIQDAVVSSQSYKTMNEAAMAAMKDALKATKDTNQGKTDYEYAGWIVTDADGKFRYTIPQMGKNRGETNAEKDVIVPKGFTKAAGYHTHGGLTSIDDNIDPKDMGVADRRHMPEYVGSVFNGNVRKYVPGVTTDNGYSGKTGDIIGRIPGY
jgi:RHS repeat-associated protein